MNNPILPMEAKVIDLSYCDLDPSNNLIELPVAEEVGNVLIESVIAEQILTSTIDSKYIIIYRTGKQVKILVTIQIFINLLFSFMYFIYYVFPVLLSYVGYRGVKLYNFRLMTIFLSYIMIDYMFHLLYFSISLKNKTFFNNLLNGFIIGFQCYVFYMSNKFTKSIKHITDAERNLLLSISENNNIRH